MEPTPLPTSAAGLPVALGSIDREIKRLWEQNGNNASRASLMNLAIYCEGRQQLERNHEIIGRISRNYACRAILICAEPDSKENNVQSWISANCHLTRAGAKQTCCDQITFLLEGETRKLIPNIVFSHLDSDLPLYLWWQGEFPKPIDRQFWTWVDRLIYDSAQWRNPCEQLSLLRESLEEIKVTLCDLNWARSLAYRQAISATFDHPENIPCLEKLNRVVITHAPGYRFTAQLFIGWFVSRLKWKQVASDRFRAPNGALLTVALEEKEGYPFGGCEIRTEKKVFTFARGENSPFIQAKVVAMGGNVQQNLFAAGSDRLSGLVLEELGVGGRHPVYLQALAVAEKLL